MFVDLLLKMPCVGEVLEEGLDVHGNSFSLTVLFLFVEFEAYILGEDHDRTRCVWR